MESPTQGIFHWGDIVIKWFWYGNAAITLIAVLVLIMGLGQLSGIDPDSTGTDSTKSNGEGQGNSAGSDSTADSALVAAVKLYSKRWEPPRGSIQVSIGPTEVLSKQPKWRVNRGAWQESNAIVEKLLVSGTHSIEFQDAEGWIKPKILPTKVEKNQVTRLTGTYRLPPPMGSLTVAINPPAAVQAKMRWRSDSDSWQNHSVKIQVPAGKHQVTFTPFPGWHTPPPITVDIQKDQMTAISGMYIEKPKGSLQVFIEPNEVLGQAKWRYATVAWQTSGATLEKILAGSYPLELLAVAGWSTPEKATVVIDPNEVTQVLAIYEEKSKGGVRVTLGPNSALQAQAQWKLDAGPWQNSGATLAGILVGPHSISVKPVSGWIAPKNQTINITENQIAEVTLVYALPPVPDPDPPEFIVKATLIVGRKGMAWIQLKGQTKPEIYFLKEEVGKYTISDIYDGFINVMRQGHKFKVEVPKPTPIDQLKPKPIPVAPKKPVPTPPKRTYPPRPSGAAERIRKMQEERAKRK